MNITTVSPYVLYTSGKLEEPANSIILTDNKYVLDINTAFTLGGEISSFSNNDFRIIDRENGETAFLVAGETINFREFRTLYDILGNNIPIWKMKHFSFPFFGKSYTFINPTTNNILFTIKRHYQWSSNRGKKLSISLTDGSTLMLQTSKMDRFGIVTWTSTTHTYLVAKISKLMKSNKITGNNGTYNYNVDISSNVDIAAILALVVCLDQENREKVDEMSLSSSRLLSMATGQQSLQYSQLSTSSQPSTSQPSTSSQPSTLPNQRHERPMPTTQSSVSN
jgi:uncharacterized protein YxjI